MLTLRIDRRARTFEPNDDLVVRIAQQAEAVREAELALAKLLLELRRTRGYLAVGCSSVEMFGAGLGFEAHEVRRLTQLAEALDAAPSLEERVRAKALSVPSAAALAPVLTEPQLFAEHDEWVERAKGESYSSLRRRTRERLAEVRCGEAVETIEVRVPDSVVERFERARDLASRKAARYLSRDETFEVVVDAYVDANDPLLVEGRARRVGPTADEPGSRYIPVSVRREVRRRAGDRCEYPGCGNRVFLEFCHRRRHARGGSREADNLLLLCTDHHFLQEAGAIRPLGPTSNPVWFDVLMHNGPLSGRDRDGEPADRDARGRGSEERRLRAIAAARWREDRRERRRRRSEATIRAEGTVGDRDPTTTVRERADPPVPADSS